MKLDKRIEDLEKKHVVEEEPVITLTDEEREARLNKMCERGRLQFDGSQWFAGNEHDWQAVRIAEIYNIAQERLNIARERKRKHDQEEGETDVIQ